MLKARKWLNFPTPLLFEAPVRGELESWGRLPDGEEIVLTQ